MNDKLKAILEKVLSFSAEKSDGDGFKTDFELLEVQNMIRDYMALSSSGQDDRLSICKPEFDSP